MKNRLSLILLCLFLLQGCHIYKVDTQQGNVITQKKVDLLRLGLDQGQVRYLLGTPLIVDTFNRNRWDYYYSLRKGGKKLDKRRHIIVYFDKSGRLIKMEGDLKTEPREIKPKAKKDKKPADTET
jgi:outer membrane protein assembly factor BamE